jgi:hypothetical protein
MKSTAEENILNQKQNNHRDQILYLYETEPSEAELMCVEPGGNKLPITKIYLFDPLEGSIMNVSLLNKGLASLRRVEHPKMRGEAPHKSSTDDQVTQSKVKDQNQFVGKFKICVPTKVMNPK